MQLLIFFFLHITLVCVTGQTTETPSYFCNGSNSTAAQFTWFTGSHSAWQPMTNCSLPECTIISNNNSGCSSLSPSCFAYRTNININSSICAPAVSCSILEPCDNITYTCASNTSVCIIDTCCSLQALCLPSFTVNFCGSASISTTWSTSTSSSTSTSLSTSTSSTTGTTSSTSTSSTTDSTSSTSTSSTTSTSTSTTTGSSTATTSSTSTSSTTDSTSPTSSSSSISTSPSKSTSTTSTTPVTTPSCTTANTVGQIFHLVANTAPTSYTLYTYAFTANDSLDTLSFVMTGDSGSAHNYWLLDSISVNHTNASANLIINGGFETGDFTGWTQYCATNTNCGSGYYGQLTSSPCQSGSNCYVDKCGNYDYLTQSFATVVGDYYILSFYARIFNSGSSHDMYVTLT